LLTLAIKIDYDISNLLPDLLVFRRDLMQATIGMFQLLLISTDTVFQKRNSIICQITSGACFADLPPDLVTPDLQLTEFMRLPLELAKLMLKIVIRSLPRTPVDLVKRCYFKQITNAS